MFYRIEE